MVDDLAVADVAIGFALYVGFVASITAVIQYSDVFRFTVKIRSRSPR